MREWIEAQRNLGDFSVPFTLTRVLPALKAPTVSEGRFWRLADGRFRWEAGKPPTTVLLFDGRQLNLWEAGKAQWQQLSPNSGGMRLWMRFLNAGETTADAMTKDFAATAASGGDKVVTITLQPKSSTLRRHVKRIDLQIDPTTHHLRHFQLSQTDGTMVTMAFGSPRRWSEADRRVSFAPP